MINEVRPSVRESLSVVEEKTKRIEALRGRKTLEKLLNPVVGGFRGDRSSPEVWEALGVPEGVELANGLDILRIYVRETSEYDSILQDEVLLSAFAAYERVSPHLWRKIYPDLTGVFLTVPSASAESIGRGAGDSPRYFVDLRLSEEIPVIRLEPNIFLVPLPARLRPWRVAAGMAPNPEYQIPIEIIDHGPL